MRNHLFIGLGGQGGGSIAELKKVIEKRHLDVKSLQNSKEPISFDFLYIDSSKNQLNNKPLWNYFGKDLTLKPADLVPLKSTHKSFNVENLAQRSDIAPWIGDLSFIKKISEGKEMGQGADQQRRFGRILVAQNANQIMKGVTNKVDSMLSNSNSCAFHIFASLAGGTGSGGIVDLVTMLRNKYDSSDVEGGFPIFLYLYVTSKDSPQKVEYFHLNQNAALHDLNALMCGKLQPTVLNTVDGKQFTHKTPINLVTLSSQISEHNKDIPLEQQRQIVAEGAFERIFAYCDKNLGENGQHYITGEDLLKLVPGEPKIAPLRSYRFSSYGMQRWEIPTEKINELLECDAHGSIYHSLLDNTWSNAKGYHLINKPKSNDQLEAKINRALQEETDHQKFNKDLIDKLNKFGDESIKYFWSKENADHRSLDQFNRHLIKRIESNRHTILDALESPSGSESRAKRVTRFESKIQELIYEVWAQKKGIGTVAIATTLAKIYSDFSSLTSDSISNSDIDLDARINARNAEWEKLAILSTRFTSKPKKLLAASKKDIIDKQIATFIIEREEENNRFRDEVASCINTLASRYEALNSSFKEQLEEIQNRKENLKKGLAGQASKQESNKCEITLEKLKPIRSQLITDKQVCEPLVALYKKDVLEHLLEHNSLTSLDQLSELISDKRDDQFKLLSESLLHDKIRTFSKNSSNAEIIGHDIMTLLENKHLKDNIALEKEIEDFITHCACLTAIDTGQLSPKVVLNSNGIDEMPRKSYIVGLPHGHSFNKRFTEIFESLVDQSSGYTVSTYEHYDPTQVRVFVNVAWMGARFASVVQELKVRATEDSQGDLTGEKTYFPNIDRSGELGTRPSLLLAAPNERKKMLLSALWFATNLKSKEGQELVQDEGDDGVFIILTNHTSGDEEAVKLATNMEQLKESPDLRAITLVTDTVESTVRELPEVEQLMLVKIITSHDSLLKSKHKIASSIYREWVTQRNYLNTFFSK